MKNFPGKNEIILQCDCENLGHAVKFTYYDSDTDYPDDYLYIQFGMDNEVPFYKRIWDAIRYIFKLKDSAWVFSESVWLPSDARDLTHFLQSYNDYIERNNLFR